MVCACRCIIARAVAPSCAEARGRDELEPAGRGSAGTVGPGRTNSDARLACRACVAHRSSLVCDFLDLWRILQRDAGRARAQRASASIVPCMHGRTHAPSAIDKLAPPPARLMMGLTHVVKHACVGAGMQQQKNGSRAARQVGGCCQERGRPVGLQQWWEGCTPACHE